MIPHKRVRNWSEVDAGLALILQQRWASLGKKGIESFTCEELHDDSSDDFLLFLSSILSGQDSHAYAAVELARGGASSKRDFSALRRKARFKAQKETSAGLVTRITD